jgi:hypothetical protein
MSILKAFGTRSWDSSGSGSERGSVWTVRFGSVTDVEPGDVKEYESGGGIEIFILVPGQSDMWRRRVMWNGRVNAKA